MNHPRPAEEAVQQRKGLLIFVVLAILTAVEYVIAVSLDAPAVLVTLLAVAAIGKCWAIAVYFMHISKLWRGEESH